MFLIITPAYLEEQNTIEKNILSVQNQKFDKDYLHFVIFDGVNRKKFFQQKYKHFRNLHFFQVRNNHEDYGDYVRRLGTKIAIRAGFKAITFLDADNYVDKDHLKQIYDIHKKTKKNIVISRRRLLIDGGNTIEKPSNFYDTNTIAIFKECIQIGSKWGKYPRELSLIGDRIISHYINLNYKSSIAFTDEITVNYRFSKISKQKTDYFKKWYLNYFSTYKDKFIKTFGYDLKI